VEEAGRDRGRAARADVREAPGAAVVAAFGVTRRARRAATGVAVEERVAGVEHAAAAERDDDVADADDRGLTALHHEPAVGEVGERDRVRGVLRGGRGRAVGGVAAVVLVDAAAAEAAVVAAARVALELGGLDDRDAGLKGRALDARTDD